MSLGENLQFLRKNAGVTQEELAERLEVSRQSVSKWEADASFPEMDKIITLCDMFGCTMDTLVKGNAEKEIREDTAGYDRHMNRFAKLISAGVGTIIFGVALSAFLDATVAESISGMIFFLFVLVAVMLFVIGGLQNDSFRKNNSHISDFYTAEEKKAYETKFPIRVAVGVGFIILGLVLTTGLEGLPESALAEALANSSFLVCTAVGTSILAYNGIMKDKYNIEKYNKEIIKDEQDGGLVGKICGVIMLVSTIIALVSLLVFKWDYFWVVFIVGGLLCAIAGIIFSGHSKKE